MTKYETMLITSTRLDEEATTKVVNKFKKLIEANGTIEAVDEWGKRRLAYPINKEEEGIYTLIYFEAGPDFNTELERVYNITDGVLRSMIIARPEGAELPKPKEAAPAPAEVKAEAPAAEAKASEPAAEAPAEEPKAEEAAAEAPAEEAKAEEPAAEAKAEEPAAEAQSEQEA